MQDTAYDRLLAAGLANADASADEIARINRSLTARDIEGLIAAKNALPIEEAIAFSAPDRGQSHTSSRVPSARPKHPA